MAFGRTRVGSSESEILTQGHYFLSELWNSGAYGNQPGFLTRFSGTMVESSELEFLTLVWLFPYIGNFRQEVQPMVGGGGGVNPSLVVDFWGLS